MNVGTINNQVIDEPDGPNEPDQPVSHLMRIPPEIRFMILLPLLTSKGGCFEIAFDDTMSYNTTNAPVAMWQPKIQGLDVAVMYANRTLFYEGLYILFSTNHFKMTSIKPWYLRGFYIVPARVTSYGFGCWREEVYVVPDLPVTIETGGTGGSIVRYTTHNNANFDAEILDASLGLQNMAIVQPPDIYTNTLPDTVNVASQALTYPQFDPEDVISWDDVPLSVDAPYRRENKSANAPEEEMKVLEFCGIVRHECFDNIAHLTLEVKSETHWCINWKRGELFFPQSEVELINYLVEILTGFNKDASKVIKVEFIRSKDFLEWGNDCFVRQAAPTKHDALFATRDKIIASLQVLGSIRTLQLGGLVALDTLDELRSRVFPS